MTNVVFVSVLHSFALAGSLFAQAVSTDAAWEARVQHGVELRLAGEEAKALETFREAAEIAKTPRLLAQMALAEQSLGRWRDAEMHLLDALSSSKDPWIVKRRVALDDALSIIQSHLGNLELIADSEGDVFVDGRPEGKLESARPIRLETGKHRIDVRRKGSFPFVRDVEILSTTTSRETVMLRPIPVDAEERNDARLSPKPSQPRTGSPSILGWSLVGGGVAVSGFGLAALLVSNAQVTKYNDDPTCTGHADESESCKSYASAGRGWRTASIASFAVGGALAVVGGVVVLWKPSNVPVSLRIVPRYAGAELGVMREF